MASRVTSRHFVGRAGELAELEAALAEARAERPGLAFVAGESGVGKTRLLGELARHARARGTRVITGDCIDLGEGELPYAPLVSALRPLVRERDPVLDAISPSARAELSTLLPELGVAAQSSEGEEGGSAQRRLFEALLALLGALGEEAGAVLVLEDIHWADRSTRAFLAFLAGSVCDEKLLAVATYRSDELHRRHPARRLLAELERHPRSRQIVVARLGRDELALQLEDILGTAPASELLDRLWARSEGNPLFVEELLAAGMDGRGAAPPTLRDALMVRVDRLSPQTQEVLHVLAVAGRADHALLVEATGLARPVLREALREAVAEHVVVAASDGAHEFRHELLREVVHDDLLPGEHSELHLTLARALEQRATGGDGGAWLRAAIAQHYLRGGDQPAALAAAVRAADAADRVRAHGEAAALLERALELWAQVPDPEALAGLDHVAVLSHASRARRLDGDDQRGAALLERALAELDESRHPRRVALVLGELAEAQWSLGRGSESPVTLRRGIALVADGEPCPERAVLLALQVRFLMLQGRYREAVDAAGPALEAVQAVGAEATRGRILNRLGVALVALSRPEQGVEALREAIAVARRAADGDDLATSVCNLADALHGAGRGQEAYAELRASDDEIPAVGRHRRWTNLTRAEIAFDLGAWEESSSLLPARTAQHSGTTLAHLDLRRAELALARADDAVARALVEEAEDLLADSIEPQYIGPVGALRAELERRSGDLGAARAAVDAAIDRIEFCSEDVRRLARVAATGATVDADAAQHARDLGDAQAERAAVGHLEEMLARLRATGEADRPVECAHLATGEAEATRARGTPDPRCWAAAAEAWAALDRPYPAALARWREAEAHLALDDRRTATSALRGARATAARLGATWLHHEVDGLASRARLRLDDKRTPARDRPSPPADDGPFGLTPRERQVLALVAAGVTNRQIGAELYMAEKTASVHVSRILAKLDVRSRTEAAALAHRHGLERDAPPAGDGGSSDLGRA